MIRNALFTMLVGATAMSAACTTELSMSDDVGDDDDDGGDDDGGGDVPDVDLSPTYALHMEARYTHCTKGTSGQCNADAPTEDSVSITGMWTVVQTGGDIKGQLSLCDATSQALGQNLVVNSTFLRSLTPFELDGDVVSIDGKAGIKTKPATVVLGIHLADAFGEDVPMQSTDARVFDQDHDGNPGVSISTGLGSVFAGMRAVYELSAAVGADGKIGGAADLTVDQGVYGDSIPFFDAVQSTKDAAQTTLITGENHTFQLVPITTATCAAATAAL